MIKFIAYYSKQAIENSVGSLNRQIANVKSVLERENEATIEMAVKYQKEGCDLERKARMSETESYIQAQRFIPTEEAKRLRKQAWDSCRNEYISALQTAFNGCRLDFSQDVVCNADGSWTVCQRLIDEITESNTTTLTEAQEEDLKIYKKFLAYGKKLSDRGYTLRDPIGNDILTSFLQLGEKDDVSLAVELFANG
jgi:hypothetical protein